MAPGVTALLASLPEVVRARPELAPLRYFVAGDRSLRATYVASLQRNTRALNRLRALLDDAAGIRLLPLKGALFAEALYGDVALRPMVDVDLAVRPAELTAAVALVERHGYRRLFDDGPRYVGRHAHDVAFVADDGGVLELHYRLFHELGMEPSIEPLFARAERAQFLGQTREVPGWSDHYFLVAAHAATHAFGDSPLWLLGLALNGERATREAAYHEAVRRRARTPFVQALRIFAAVFAEAPPPLSFADEQRGLVLDRLVGVERVGDTLPQWRSLVARALLADRARDAVALLGAKAALRFLEWRRST